MSRRERGLLIENNIGMPRLRESKLSETMPPPCGPTVKSKARILSDLMVNRESRSGKLSNPSKAALERQRENASKLAAGRSVVHKADKENEVSKKNLVKLPIKPQKLKKIVEKKPEKLKKTESIGSLYTVEEVRRKVSEPAGVQPFEPAEVIKQLEAVKIPDSTGEPEPKEESDKTEEIPSNVNIIDKEDELMSSEFLLGSYAKDIYNFLRYLEDSQIIRKDYLTSSHIMTQHMRALLVDWLFDVQHSFKLLNETIQIAIALLDRFMQDHPGIPKNELQLVGVACIFLAAKYEEMYPPDLTDLVDISAKTYTKSQILKMEQIIFSSLCYQMGRPPPSQFLRRYGRAGKVDIITYCFSKYFIDLALVNYAMCHIPPSLLAASALYLALFLMSSETNPKFWTPTLEYYSQYNWETLAPVVRKLALLVWEAPNSKYKTVSKKYLDPKKLYSVSARSELKSDKLYKLAYES